MKTLFSFILYLYFFNVQDQPIIPTVEVQIKTAVLAAPAELQAEATVYGSQALTSLPIIKTLIRS